MVQLGSNCVVCNEAVLTGEVKLGNGCVIHPKAQILAEKGPIEIGEANLIEENVYIRNTSSSPMKIGNHNIFEVGCVVEAKAVGDNNVIEAKAVVGPKVTVTNGTVIGAKCEVMNNEVLLENCAIFGSSYERHIMGEKPLPQTSQLEFLRKVLPNFHHLMQ